MGAVRRFSPDGRPAAGLAQPWCETGLRVGAVRAAFTLAELLVVIAIMAILALCVMRATQGAADRADVVRCMGNLRGLHIALATAVTEEGQWPQCPFSLGTAGYDTWWIKTMSKYQISEANWTCPTLMRLTHAKQEEASSGKAKIHYIPTAFDANPSTPRRWRRQPWLIETADMHGEGNLICFPDGAIIGSNRYLSGQM